MFVLRGPRANGSLLSLLGHRRHVDARSISRLVPPSQTFPVGATQQRFCRRGATLPNVINRSVAKRAEAPYATLQRTSRPSRPQGGPSCQKGTKSSQAHAPSTGVSAASQRPQVARSPIALKEVGYNKHRPGMAASDGSRGRSSRQRRAGSTRTGCSASSSGAPATRRGR